MAPVSGSTSLLGFIHAPRPAIVRPYWNWARDARSAIAQPLVGRPGDEHAALAVEHEVVHGDLQLLGRELQDRVARLDRRSLDRVAHPVGRPADANVPMSWGPVSVSAVSTTIWSYGTPERLGRDLGHHGPQPLAEVRGGEDHVERAARGGVDQGLGRVAAQVHAGGVVDGRHAGAAQPRHRSAALLPAGSRPGRRHAAPTSSPRAPVPARGPRAPRPPASSRSASRRRSPCGAA